MPMAVLCDAVAPAVGPDRAVDVAMRALEELHRAGYRICVRCEADRQATAIMAAAIARRLRLANVTARGAAGWILHDLHDEGWRVVEVDPLPPDPPMMSC
jgi:methylphosphotriester-DNA--protein-cysteine methyltransferase